MQRHRGSKFCCFRQGKIINYVNNLNDNKSDVLYLILYLLDIYKINDLELFMKIMSISDCELLKK